MGALLDMAAMIVTTTGNGGPLYVNAIVAGYQSFANAGAVNNQVFSYSIQDANNAWEIGKGTYVANGTNTWIANASGGTIRFPIFSSLTGNAPIVLSGNAQVFATFLDEDWETQAVANSISVGNSLINTTGFFISGVAVGGGGVGGSTTQVQFNDGGAANGSSSFTFTKASNTVTIGNTSVYLTLGPNGLTYTNSTAVALSLASVGVEVGNYPIGAYSIIQSSQIAVSDGFSGNTLYVNSSQINAFTFYAASDVNVGANVYMNTTSLSIGNSTSNIIANSSLLDISANTGLNLGIASIGAQGYSYLPNGLILQWGSNTANSTAKNVSYPIVFPNAVLSLTVSSGIAAVVGNTGATVSPHAVATNTTLFSITSSNTAASLCYWMAIGH